MSKAFVNVMASLTCSGFLAERVAQLYRDRTRNKTVLEMCGRIGTRVSEARQQWPTVEAKEVHRIVKHVMHFEDTICKPSVTVPEWSSVCLGMLDEVLRHMKDKRRREAIERVMSAVSALHRYFDRHNDRDEDYEAAGRVVDRWQELVA